MRVHHDHVCLAWDTGQVMKTKGTGGYVEFLWLQNILFILSVVLVIFFFKADLKVAPAWACAHPQPRSPPSAFAPLPSTQAARTLLLET